MEERKELEQQLSETNDTNKEEKSEQKEQKKGGAAGTFFSLSLFLLLSVRWLFAMWPKLSLQELLQHISHPFEGSNLYMLLFFLLTVLLPTWILSRLCRRWLRVGRFQKSIFLLSVLFLSLAIGIAANDFIRYAYYDTEDSGLAKKNRIREERRLSSKGEEVQVEEATYSKFIGTNYVDPDDVNLIFPKKKKNLIMIYLESMETAYADQEDGGIFESNVIPELTKLAQETEDFSGSSQKLNGAIAVPDTTWTMAGLFASSSGLPLKTDSSTNVMTTQNYFFSSLTTLGDLLFKEGYQQAICMGSKSFLEGRKKYFTEHGHYQIYDYNYAVQNGYISEDYYKWRGMEDEKLYAMAKEKLIEMAASGEVFNFTMLTADSDYEDGYVCDLCDSAADMDQQYQTVLSCSSRQLSDFVDWLKVQDFYGDTALVVVGDHPTMDSDLLRDTPEDYSEKIYTAYVHSFAHNLQPRKNREYTSFDLFPTTLAAMGVIIPGNRLGLGTNLYSTRQTLLERYGQETMSIELQKSSKFMKRMANIKRNDDLVQAEAKGFYIGHIELGKMDYDTASFTAEVSKIANTATRIEKVYFKVYREDEEEHAQTIEASCLGQSRYQAQIDLSAFGELKGNYYIAAYAKGVDGQVYFAGRRRKTLYGK